MMHPVEEVSPQLQPIQVSTGPGLLAAGTLFSLTLPLYFEKKGGEREKERKAATGVCSVIVCQFLQVQMWRWCVAVHKHMQTDDLVYLCSLQALWKPGKMDTVYQICFFFLQ